MNSTYLKEDQNKLYVISGPSGVGRTSVIKSVLKELDNISFSTSYTTRKRRSEEINHVDYHFVSENAFKKLIENKNLLEWAKVFNHYYGTSIEEVQNKLAGGQDVILDIDVQGASQLMEKISEITLAVFIFLAPPSQDELRKRLRKRGTEDQKQLKLRLSKASMEMKKIPEFDYLIINDQLGEAVSLVKSIVLAERCRIAPSDSGKNGH